MISQNIALTVTANAVSEIPVVNADETMPLKTTISNMGSITVYKSYTATNVTLVGLPIYAGQTYSCDDANSKVYLQAESGTCNVRVERLWRL